MTICMGKGWSVVIGEHLYFAQDDCDNTNGVGTVSDYTESIENLHLQYKIGFTVSCERLSIVEGFTIEKGDLFLQEAKVGTQVNRPLQGY